MLRRINSCALRPAPNLIGSTDPHVLKIPARGSASTLTENARSPIQAESGQSTTIALAPINSGPAETQTIEVRRSSECRGSAGSQIGKAGCFTRIRNVSCLRGLDRFVIKRYPSKAPIKTRGELAPQLRRASFEAKSFGSQPGLRSPRFSNQICRVEALRLMDSQLPQPVFLTRRRGEVDERRVSRRHAPLGARRRTWTVR